MKAPKSKWVDIGSLEAIPVRGARVVRTPAGCIAVFRTSENQVFAIDDTCPHKAGPLSQGIVHSSSVTCPLHNWVIDLATGEAQGPDTGAVKTYALKVEAGRILLDVPALARAAVTPSPHELHLHGERVGVRGGNRHNGRND